MKDETKFRQNKVLPFLKKLKNTAYFPIQQSSISGTPDFLVCVNGTFVALELKSELGKISKLQAYQLWRVLNSGGITLVAKPSNWHDIKDQLTKLDTGGIK